MGKYFIGIDSGTQSTKTIIVDGKTGKVLGSASQAYELIKGLPAGAKEQHPKDWIAAVKATIAKALKAAKVNPRDVAAIGVSGQQHGFVPLDAKGQVIRPAKLWCDTATSPQADKLVKKLGGVKKTVSLTGNSIPAGFTASKILWLKENEPAHYRRLDCVLLPHDYINFWLTGERVMEYGEASGTALMDVRSRKWRKEVINAIDPALAGKLPRLQSSDKPAGVVRPEVAKLFGFGPGVIVSAGGGDNMMGAIGTGNVDPGCVTASFGTSGTIYAYSKKPVIDPEGQIAAFCDSTGAWMPLLCTMNVTVATEMVKKSFGWTNEKLAAQVAEIAPGADGLLLVPYLEGERTPNVPDGTGVYFGVNTRTFAPAHFARAAMEGVTLGMNYGLNRLRKLGIRPKEIRITGGGANSPVWRQIMADIFGCPVVCLETGEGAALGGAVQAMWCYELSQGRKTTIQALCRKFVKVDRKTLVKPIARNVAVYRRLQALQDGFATDCAGLFSAHRKLLGAI
ncbi:xylulokinase [Kamptonema cortianum]|nr:xylulokinase [Kamptonema cortianum]MDL5044518.1 xylulokinase [Oscillatoria amoena NRMC-F 0135]